MTLETPSVVTRRYDLDWLRVGAFGLLIFYHIGMFYVSWGFHVKSVHAGPAAEPFMKLLNPWRLSLLFFVSGIALRFAIDKADLGRFALKRTGRLALPILFGMVVIVAPQSWLQLLEQGEIESGFWAFYPNYLLSEPGTYSITVPTWNHLWYVVYLLVYTLILCALTALPSTSIRDGFGRAMTWAFRGSAAVFLVIAIPASWFALHRLFLAPAFPSTHALVGDWGNHFLYFGVTLFAFVIAKNEAFWQAVSKSLLPAAMLALSLGVWQFFVWTADVSTVSSLAENEALVTMHAFARPIYAWAAILCLLGVAQRWLNRPGPALTYMTEAIFPWYILHQTLFILAGFWLTRQALPVWTEFALVTGATVLGCHVLHEYIIRRSNLLRPLFGLKPLERRIFSDVTEASQLR